MSARSLYLISALFLGLATALPVPAADTAAPPAVGRTFPAVELPCPRDPTELAYLGLPPGCREFSPTKLPARLVILEVFSLSCPYCQEEAAKVNQLYELIAARGLEDRIKLLGVGHGNVASEVQMFKGDNQVRFPLLPDPEERIYDRLGRPYTPYFFVLDLASHPPGRIVHAKLGRQPAPEKFLRELLAKTKLSR
ncbi:MAG: TlpA family protein disulfide reductase [Deltaproteobacteria bacterium]|nr:TlpA family protein disulfide reductase [Deltaproteobacteria bacterium]